jgi:hypothetical protein
LPDANPPPQRPNFSTALDALKRQAEADPQVEKTVREILHAVRQSGDSAVLDYTHRFGGPRLTPKELRLTGKPKVDSPPRKPWRYPTPTCSPSRERACAKTGR